MKLFLASIVRKPNLLNFELKWGSLVEFNLSQNIQTSYNAKVGDRRKLQFRCIYKEMNEVVRRGNNKNRIIGALIKHAIQICKSVISMLENQGEVYIARKEDIQSQVFQIVNKQQPKVKETIIQSGYFSENRQDLLSGTAHKISELFFNTISRIDEGRYFYCK